MIFRAFTIHISLFSNRLSRFIKFHYRFGSIIKKTSHLLICLFAFQFSSAAQDSSHLRVSLLTCTPGDELYSIFGHSAIRIIDSSSVTDIVYNYGTFNFDDEGFYMKFARGKLNYYLSIANFEEFKFDYQATNRGITEQVLKLTASEKINFQRALNDNLKEENKYYQYDFFLDNCTTRLRDIIVKVKQPSPQLPAVIPSDTKFREAIHQYLNSGKKYWSKLAIDILLGARTDGVMSVSQQQFLPDNLMYALDSTSNVTIVQSKENLYKIDNSNSGKTSFTPMMFFLLLLIIFILLSYSENKRTQALLAGLDGFLFFITGLLGIILIFMWVATDHSMTKINFNLLWAWPTHLFISFVANRNNKLVKKYFFITACLLSMLLIVWFFLPQQMNNALVPFILLLIFRSSRKYLQ